MIQAVPLTAIRIVLVEPSHPGNIGAVARAMKNMGLSDLVLVRPKAYPHPDASARASGAGDLLDRARVVDSVTDAVADVGFVAATTSRPRDQNFRALDLHDAAARIFEMSQRGPAAVLFGAERTGLTNEELALAHLLIRIPANPDYPSLNLAMAVQLTTYELFRAAGSPASSRPLSEPVVPLAPGADMERFYTHLQQVMDEVDFKDRTVGGTHLMTRIRRLFQRCEMDQNEVNILRGILTSVQQKRIRAGGARKNEAPGE
ncbi:MAG: tRNA (cytidine32/uridine32-2-O)-methyltransferase [Steroidobacteraceae bacterium]|jgi:TrmH family RNA methyltransferase|nr:tRNA (cytidine32/uridine32-2-O)-methyltransferase [Steroidobacteraceae bacterium]